MKSYEFCMLFMFTIFVEIGAAFAVSIQSLQSKRRTLRLRKGNMNVSCNLSQDGVNSTLHISHHCITASVCKVLSHKCVRYRLITLVFCYSMLHLLSFSRFQISSEFEKNVFQDVVLRLKGLWCFFLCIMLVDVLNFSPFMPLKWLVLVS